MGKPAIQTESSDLSALVGDIVQDAGRLLGQQVDLLRAEVGEELRRVGGAGASVAAGGGLAAAGGLLAGQAAVHLVHKATGLPLWASYGAVGGAMAGAAALLLRKGAGDLAAVRLLPQTTEAVGENLTWLKDQLTPAAG